MQFVINLVWLCIVRYIQYRCC